MEKTLPEKLHTKSVWSKEMKKFLMELKVNDRFSLPIEHAQTIRSLISTIRGEKNIYDEIPVFITRTWPNDNIIWIIRDFEKNDVNNSKRYLSSLTKKSMKNNNQNDEQ